MKRPILLRDRRACFHIEPIRRRQKGEGQTKRRPGRGLKIVHCTLPSRSHKHNIYLKAQTPRLVRELLVFLKLRNDAM